MSAQVHWSYITALASFSFTKPVCWILEISRLAGTARRRDSLHHAPTVNAQTRDRRKGVQPPTTWFLMTPKTSWNGESPVWKPACLGRRTAVTHPSLNQQLPGKQTDIPNVFAVRVNYLLYRAQKSAMKHSMSGLVLTKFAVWKWQLAFAGTGYRPGSSGDHFHNLSVLF